MRSLPLHPGARGLEDDCAVLEIGSETLVLTHDAMAQGVHFLPDADPYDTAWKLVASNLSDLAAKGAQPMGVLLGYTLGGDDARFVEGLAAILDKYDVPLLGGDTISSKGSAIHGLTAIGRAEHTPVPSRSRAQVGDDVFVCGTIGDAMAGFNELMAARKTEEIGSSIEGKGEPDPYFLFKFLRPVPLIEEGQSLAPYVNAMMDVSDGLFLDASRMAQASGVTFSLELDAVPMSEKFRQYASDGNQLDLKTNGWPARMEACAWGDDYALLFTASPGTKLPISAAHMGKVQPPSGHPLLIDAAPPDSARLGYNHA